MTPIVRDAGNGLRRNLTMTFAVILCSAVSLALLGAGLLLQRQVGITSDALFGRVELNIYLSDDVTPDQQQALVRPAGDRPADQELRLRDAGAGLRAGQEALRRLARAARRPRPGRRPRRLPRQARRPAAFAQVADAYRTQPGVDSVPDLRKLLDSFFRWLNGFKLAAFVLAAVQGFATLVLLYNTIRVSAHTRRRETSIMRLVGASNAYIRAPFVLESAAAGLFGGLLASGSLIALYLALVRRVFAAQHFTTLIGAGDVAQVCVLAMLAGIALSCAMAWVALRRHLRAADPKRLPRRRATDVPEPVPAGGGRSDAVHRVVRQSRAAATGQTSERVGHRRR